MPTRSGRKEDGDRALAGSGRLQGKRVKGGKAKKRKPIREESFPAELVFQRNDFSYIDAIVDLTGLTGLARRDTFPHRCSWRCC